MNKRKVAIIGVGHVGSHVAMSLCFQGSCDEIVLVDCDKEKAVAQGYDIADGCLFLPSTTKVYAGDYEDCADADIIVISVGAPRKPGQTRLDVLDDSIIMIRDVISNLKPLNYNGIIISITNPADVIGHYIRAELGMDRTRCFSTGTSLDTARLKRTMEELGGIDRKSVTGISMGEHGNSSFIPFSSMTVGGLDYKTLRNKSEKYASLEDDIILERTRNIGNDIIEGKGSTEFGIGVACADMIKAIFHNEKRVIPASVLLCGEYGMTDVSCGVPCVIGANGIEDIIELPLNDQEMEMLEFTCDVIRKNVTRAENL